MTGTAAAVACLLVGLAGAALAAVRWLRVAQREHYLAGSVSRFARRWWALGPNRVLGGAAVAAALLTLAGARAAGVVAGAAVAVGPFGLSLRGRTAKLVWTRRLRTLAAATAVLVVAPVLLALLAGAGPAATVAVLVAVLTPLLVDAALAATAPVERRLVQRFVDQAAATLRSVAPEVVAITGSYGKTTTKGYVAHLVAGTRTVVATPASFNNRAGIARAVNEHLVPGTEVFVAEMGTYGPGELAELCSWVRPRISVITAIGPVHLERFGSEDRIAEAKAEITATAEVAVLNVDDPRLEALASRLEGAGTKVVRCSAGDVAGLPVPPGAHPTNVACAVAIARLLGVPDDAVTGRVASLPTAAHRLSVSTGASGATVLDDTYNANPAGAAAALEALARHGADSGRKVVVTPGMVELGPRQGEENARFAAAAAAAASDVVVVGHTNRRALVKGLAGGSCRVVLVDTRDQATAWARQELGPGDVVLYENDLPDHFP
jgi:UDP-N-acetylmuramoyl-tripeptide--D-alanyl-D-alanine ligase